MDRNGDPQFAPDPNLEGNGHTVDPSVPAYVPQQPVQVVGGAPAAEEQQEAGIQISAVLAAFRRRWFTAISLGVILGAAAAATVWYVTPVTYTSYAELQFDMTPVLLRLTGNRRVRRGTKVIQEHNDATGDVPLRAGRRTS